MFTRATLLAAAILPALYATSAHAQSDVDDLAAKAIDASMRFMAGALLCSELLGDSYISVARMTLEQTYRAGGYDRNDVIIAADDAEQHLRKQQGDRSVLDSVKGDVTKADVHLSCQQTLSEAMRAAEVANARLAKASGM